MKSYDVVVIGGGPIGAVAARSAAEEGATVLLVERRSRVEELSACTGLVSLRTLPALGASDRCVVRRIRAAAIHGPRGGATFRAAEDKAVVVDRSALERELLALAAAAGVDVRLGTTAVGAEPGTVRIRDENAAKAIRTEVVIGADGPQSKTAAWFGLSGPAETLQAFQAEVIAVAQEQDRVEVFVGGRVAPGFFAWAVPAEPGRLRVGLAGLESVGPARRLESLIAEQFPGCRVLSLIEAPIPMPPIPRITGERVLLVGDAAAQVKPWSGGGLYFGGVCARLAGRTAARAVRAGDVTTRGLRRYEESCQRVLGREIRYGLALRSLLQSLEDPQINAALDALRDEELDAFIAREADIDHPSRLLTRIASHPRLWTRLFPLWEAIRGADGSRRQDDSLGSTPPSCDLV